MFLSVDMNKKKVQINSTRATFSYLYLWKALLLIREYIIPNYSLTTKEVQCYHFVSRHGIYTHIILTVHLANSQPTLSQLSVNSQPTLSQRSANAQPTLSQLSANAQPPLSQLSDNSQTTSRQLADNSRPTLSQLSAN